MPTLKASITIKQYSHVAPHLFFVFVVFALKETKIILLAPLTQIPCNNSPPQTKINKHKLRHKPFPLATPEN